TRDQVAQTCGQAPNGIARERLVRTYCQKDYAIPNAQRSRAVDVGADEIPLHHIVNGGSTAIGTKVGQGIGDLNADVAGGQVAQSGQVAISIDGASASDRGIRAVEHVNVIKIAGWIIT